MGLPHHPLTPFPPLPEDCTVVQPGILSCCTAASGHQCKIVVCDAHCQNLGTVPPGWKATQYFGIKYIEVFIYAADVIAGLSQNTDQPGI